MQMPLVSEGIIASIREQAVRASELNKLYSVDVMQEMREENPHLAAAIKDTVSMFAEEFGLDINNPKEYSMLLNIANLAVSIYSSIKQQMICDELDD